MSIQRLQTACSDLPNYLKKPSNCTDVIRLRTNSALFKALIDCTRKSSILLYSSGTARIIISGSKLRNLMRYKVENTHTSLLPIQNQFLLPFSRKRLLLRWIVDIDALALKFTLQLARATESQFTLFRNTDFGLQSYDFGIGSLSTRCVPYTPTLMDDSYIVSSRFFAFQTSDFGHPFSKIAGHKKSKNKLQRTANENAASIRRICKRSNQPKIVTHKKSTDSGIPWYNFECWFYKLIVFVMDEKVI